MNLAETYAAYCGCQINIPHMEVDETNIPSEPYLTVHSWCEKETNRRYAHWPAVVSLISSVIKWPIFQVGGISDPWLYGAQQRLGTNTKQLAGLLKHSKCHFGYESFPMHVASVFDTPIVAIFRNYIEQSYPVWSSKEKVKLFIPELTHSRPPYGHQELETAINKINPKDIADAVLLLLKM